MGPMRCGKPGFGIDEQEYVSGTGDEMDLEKLEAEGAW